jgi:hypothetical protein
LCSWRGGCTTSFYGAPNKVQEDPISLEIFFKRTMFFGKSKGQEGKSPAKTSAHPLARTRIL